MHSIGIILGKEDIVGSTIHEEIVGWEKLYGTYHARWYGEIGLDSGVGCLRSG